MPIELFHTHSKDFGRDVLGNVKNKTKQTKNKQTNKQKKAKITKCVIA